MQNPSVASVRIALIFGVALLGSCKLYFRGKYHYPNNIALSDSLGRAKDSTMTILPKKLHFQFATVNTRFKWYSKSFYSSVLMGANEPLLYNFYSGVETYRVVLEGFKYAPKVLCIHRLKDSVWLDYKEMYIREDSTVQTTLFGSFYVHDSAQKTLKTGDWNEFLRLLKKTGFWHQRVRSRPIFVLPDESSLFIEAHTVHDYWIVKRIRPKASQLRLVNYLLELLHKE